MTTGNSLHDRVAAGAEALTEAAFRTGDYAEADRLLRAALADARATGDRAAEAEALDRIAWLLHFTAIDNDLVGADPDAEAALFSEALAIRRELDDPAGVGRSLFGAALVHQVLRSDGRTAVPLLREALALALEHDDLLTASEAHRHLGFARLIDAGDADGGVAHLRSSLTLRERYGDERWIPSGTVALGEATFVAGDPAEAVRLLKLAVDQARAATLSPRRIASAEDALRQAEAGEPPAARRPPEPPESR